MALAVAAPGQRPAASTATGVYSEAQAAQGAMLYKDACAACHGETLAGTYEIPALTGRFLRNWSNGSVGTLFDYIGRAMPQMAPGSLTPEDNARIVAYLLKANGMPAGAQPLPADQGALDRIAFAPR
nr:cytochrome c [Sphingomonas quercus]